ncbi:RHS repeat-associated core domain-containing protein [Paenibacillus hamazuiensis]|uniref:RHS repeat-associated core domain-containing protein n=1 Tax=Paenibacillus hamazuiensis TaxID=2936508 RepID=UPI00200C6917|nr:RHS repeat-associated core domain-containing protein [Paenibacillus hamazuiensis]
MDNPYRYTGEPQDDESGLIYLRAGYYDPTVGRLISQDTVEGDLNNLLSLNLYTYEQNNPLRYTDPSGRCIEGDDICNESEQNKKTRTLC